MKLRNTLQTLVDKVTELEEIVAIQNIYIGNTTTLIGKVTLPIKLEPATPFDTEDKLQASVVRRLKRLVTLSDSMLDLEQAIIGNYNNKLIEY